MATLLPTAFTSLVPTTLTALLPTLTSLIATPTIPTITPTITCINLDKDHDDHNDPNDNDDCFQVFTTSGITTSVRLPKTERCDGPGEDDCTSTTVTATGAGEVTTMTGTKNPAATGGSVSRPPNNNGASGRRIVGGMAVGVVAAVAVSMVL